MARSAEDLRRAISVCVDVGVNANDCGYCGGEDCSVSHGMPVRGLSVYQYQGAAVPAGPLRCAPPGPLIPPHPSSTRILRYHCSQI